MEASVIDALYSFVITVFQIMLFFTLQITNAKSARMEPTLVNQDNALYVPIHVLNALAHIIASHALKALSSSIMGALSVLAHTDKNSIQRHKIVRLYLAMESWFLLNNVMTEIF